MLNEFRVSRGGPMMKMVVNVAANSLRKALADDREGFQNLIEVLKQYVHSDFGVNLIIRLIP